MMLLLTTQPRLVEELPDDIWIKWTPTVLAYPEFLRHHNRQGQCTN